MYARCAATAASMRFLATFNFSRASFDGIFLSLGELELQEDYPLRRIIEAPKEENRTVSIALNRVRRESDRIGYADSEMPDVLGNEERGVQSPLSGRTVRLLSEPRRSQTDASGK